MNAQFSWRKTMASDLAECLKLHPAKNGAEIVGQAAALKAWQKLFALKHSSRSAVVEMTNGKWRTIVGFGFASFVKSDFFETELSNPQPGLNARIIASIVNGNSVIAEYDEVRDANTRSDIRQVVLDTSWSHEHLDANQVASVRVLLGRAYQEIFSGYRFSYVMTELVDELDLQQLENHPTFRIVDRFERYRRAHPESTWNVDRGLAVASVASMEADPHSIAAELFYHPNEPQFAFARGEQELLEAALEGMDDAEAAKALFISVAAIKRRWASIFERVANVMPELCPPGVERTRGVQKRQRVLGYVRSHPEELRPFKAPSRSASPA